MTSAAPVGVTVTLPPGWQPLTRESVVSALAAVPAAPTLPDDALLAAVASRAGRPVAALVVAVSRRAGLDDPALVRRLAAVNAPVEGAGGARVLRLAAPGVLVTVTADGDLPTERLADDAAAVARDVTVVQTAV